MKINTIIHQKLNPILLLVCAALPILLSGCISWHGPVRDVKYSYSGDHIFYWQSIFYFTPIHPIESSKIYYSDINLENKKLLYTGDVHDGLILNSSKNMVLFTAPVSSEKQTKLILYDYNLNEIIFTKAFEWGAPLHIGWQPNGENFFFTDKDGMQLYSNTGVFIKTILKYGRWDDSHYYCMDWNKNSDAFIYLVEKGSFPISRLLYYHHYPSNTNKLIAKANQILHSSFLDADNIVYVSKESSDCYIYKLNLSDLQKILLFKTNGYINKIKVIDDQYFLFSVEEKELFKKKIYLLTNKQLLTKLIDVDCSQFPWDYNENTKSIIYKQTEVASPFQEFQLKPLLKYETR